MNFPYRMNHGDLYYSPMNGGGGLGDPLEREAELIEEDLNGDFILPRYAERVYGAVVSNDDEGVWCVDPEATSRNRKAMKEERRRRAVPVEEYLTLERERIIKGEFKEEVNRMYNQSIELSSSWGNRFREFWSLPPEFRFPEGP